MGMMPELKAAKFVTDLENLRDSIKLGQVLIVCGMLAKLKQPS